MPPPPPSPSRPLGGPLSLLQLSLFLKIVIAGTLLLGGAAGAGVLVAHAVPDSRLKLILALGILAVVVANALVVHLALLPLRAVEAVVRRVESGDLSARVPVSPLADREMSRVIELLNRTLEAMSRSRADQAALAARIAEAEEAERKRISHELLSETAQLLSSVLVRIRLVERALPPGDPTRTALDAARSETRDALAEIGRIARGLRPPELDELGPFRALEMQARHLTEGTGIRVRVDRSGIRARAQGGPALDPRQSLALYRILLEGITNAVRHGAPALLSLRFFTEGTAVVAELEDDGRGFLLEETLRAGGDRLGIARMFDRARAAGGTLAIRSNPGEGTRLRFELPGSIPRETSPGPGRDVGSSPTPPSGLCRTDGREPRP